MGPMSESQKAEIDAMSYEDMLHLYRFSPIGHPYFEMGTEVAEYFAKRLQELKVKVDPTLASKRVGHREDV